MTSLDTLRPDQATDSTGIGGPSRRRTWTLVVTCAGVALVVASMVALNAAPETPMTHSYSPPVASATHAGSVQSRPSPKWSGGMSLRTRLRGIWPKES